MKKGVIACMAGMVSFAAGFFLGGKTLVNMINDYKMRMERNNAHLTLMDEWLEFLYSGRKLDEYFHARKYRKIMIYGFGGIGSRLSQALEHTDIEVVCIMDKGAAVNTGMVVGTDAEIPDVDCIVVTPVFYYNDIFHMLREKTDIPIVSMQTVLEEKL